MTSTKYSLLYLLEFLVVTKKHNDNDNVFIFNHNHNKCLAKGTPALPVDDTSRNWAEGQRRTWPKPETIHTRVE